MPALAGAVSPTTGHADFPPTTVTGGSNKVFVQGKPVLSQDNLIHITHCNPDTCHSGTLASGSEKVFVEGSPAARIGDPITCGDTIAGGDIKVNCA